MTVSLADPQKNLKRAVSAGLDGADAATKAADRQFTRWTDRALAFLAEYIKENKGKNFMGEDVRIAAERSGKVPPPPDSRAWGGVILIAKNSDLIRFVCYGQAKDPKSHGNPKSVWIGC